MSTSPRTAVGVFANRNSARDAVADLYRAGFRDDQIGLVSKYAEHETGWKGDPTHTRWEEGAGVGAATGAVTGAGLGLAVMSGLIPGIGPAIAGGALLALIASAGAGAGAGAIVGSLVGLGIPEADAQFYEKEFTSGRTIVTVQSDGRYEEAMALLRKHGGTEHHQEISAAAPSADDMATYGNDVEATPY